MPRRLDAVFAVRRSSETHAGTNLPDIVVDPGMFPEASWLYVSETKYQEEVVWLLQYQEKVQPKKSSSFCTIA